MNKYTEEETKFINDVFRAACRHVFKDLPWDPVVSDLHNKRLEEYITNFIYERKDLEYSVVVGRCVAAFRTTTKFRYGFRNFMTAGKTRLTKDYVIAITNYAVANGPYPENGTQEERKKYMEDVQAIEREYSFKLGYCL